MKLYMLESPKKIKIIEKELPSIQEDEVLIKVNNIGLCGSDIQLYNGTYKGPLNYPILFGHEWSGTVIETGKSVKKVAPGDRVTGDCSKFCGTCELCKYDKNLCNNVEKFGITVDGASAEYIVRKEKYVYKAPGDLDFELICLAEPFAVSSHLIRKINGFVPSINEKKILIYGGGPIGLSAFLILTRHYGCKNVYLLDIIEKRSELARGLGANISLSNVSNLTADSSNYSSIYSKAVFDLIIESTGNQDVFRNSLELVKPLGLIGCLGMMQELTINQKLIVMKGITITGSIGGTGEFPFILNFLKEHKEDVRKIISHKISISDVDKAFDVGQRSYETLKIELVLD